MLNTKKSLVSAPLLATDKPKKIYISRSSALYISLMPVSALPGNLAEGIGKIRAFPFYRQWESGTFGQKKITNARKHMRHGHRDHP